MINTTNDLKQAEQTNSGRDSESKITYKMTKQLLTFHDFTDQFLELFRIQTQNCRTFHGREKKIECRIS